MIPGINFENFSINYTLNYYYNSLLLFVLKLCFVYWYITILCVIILSYYDEILIDSKSGY